MTPSQPTDQQVLVIEKDDRRYEVLIGQNESDGQVMLVVMGVRDAITRKSVGPGVIDEKDINDAWALLVWAFENDPEIVDGPQPVTRLFIEEGDRHFEVVVGKTKESQLVPLGIRNAINHCDLDEDEMPSMDRFTDAVKMWVWASANDPDNQNEPLNINFVEGDDG